ncbi:MAG: S-layer homology domain-containing protein [Candidatus Saganbacteria bacterium]|nr:S-layer homology domain-containing protein [Candidatus Saganbacteria bacterium]
MVVCHSALAVNGVGSDPSLDLFSARQLGLGGLTVNFADDAGGVFANPAGLAELEFPQLTTSSRRLTLGETQYLLAGWALPTAWGTFGLGYSAAGAGGSLPTMLDPGTGRVIQDPSREAGSFSNSVIAFSYARTVPAPVKLAVGGNLKLFNQSLSGAGAADRGSGFGLDLGCTCQALPWLTAAAGLKNLIGGSVRWSGSEDTLGSAYRLGVAATILGGSREAFRTYPQKLTAGLEFDLPGGVLAANNSLLYHLGCEYFPLKNIALRAGLNQETAGTGLALGLGLVNGGFRFDYAFVQRPGLPGDNPHYFSLSYIGERVLTCEPKLKLKSAHLKFLFPYDRLITDKDIIPVRAEAWGDRVVDQKRIWTVTAVSATFDVVNQIVTEPLASVALGDKKLDQEGTIETTHSLKLGWNDVRLTAFTSPEIFAGRTYESKLGSAEARVLRIVPFTDTPMNYWAIEPIALMGVLGLVNGYPDNSFRPEKGITRAELVTLLVKSLALPQETLDSYASVEAFKDVPLHHWAAKYIACADAQKYVTGYPDGRFAPNKVLSRAEGATIMARYAKLAPAGGTKSFVDLKDGFWAAEFINAARQAGLLKYLEGKDFKPDNPFTRAEACEVLYRVPAVQSKVDQYWESGLISAGR